MPAYQDASQILDSNITILKELKRLSRMPGFLEQTTLFIGLMKGGVQANGHETAPKPLPNWDTGLKAAVLKALMRIRGEFTYKEVIRAMEEDAYRFQTKEPRNAVNGVLRQLIRKGKLVEVKKGDAGKPSVFRHAGSS